MSSPPLEPRTAAKRGPGRPARAGDETSSAEVRERLLLAAMELAVEQGLDGVGIRQIADRAGVSSGMISYYFGDRRGLHSAMSTRAFEELSAEFTKAIADQSADADILDTLIGVHATALSANPWLPRLIAQDLLVSDAEDGAETRLSSALGDGPLQLMQSAIQSAIDRGELRADIDPIMCVLTIASTGAFPYLMGPLLSECLGLDLDDDFRDRLIAHNRDLIANGLRAPAQKEKL
jgi:AcrR family transcriptional regulator